MKDIKFEEMLKKELKKEAEYIGVSDFLKTRIDMEITGRQEEIKMKKKLSIKKCVLTAACVCLLMPVGLFASGKISGYVSTMSIRDNAQSDNWKDLNKLEKKTGIDSDAVQSFSNGFIFQRMAVNSFAALDENGNKMFRAKELNISYQNKSGSQIECYMRASDDRMTESEDESAPDLTAEYDGVTVSLRKSHYKFVPENYELTEEDKKLEEQGDYFISYGSDKIENQEVVSVTWEKDGVHYHLMGIDVGLSAQNMMAMAGEMIQK